MNHLPPRSAPLPFTTLFRSCWVHSAAAGVRGSLFPEMVESRVLLTNSAGIHAVPIAETVIGGLLHLLRGLDMAVDQQRERRTEDPRLNFSLANNSYAVFCL